MRTLKSILSVISLLITSSLYAQIETKLQDSDFDQDTVYQVVEEMPQFPGGVDKLKSYLRHNLRYPQVGDVDVQGRIIVSFIVEKDGSITNAKIVRGLNDGYGFDRNALNLIKEMPAWIPGKKDGKNVRVSYIVPVNYRINPNTEE